jgi:hypothetical protein
MIAALLPEAAYGNTIPVLHTDDEQSSDEMCYWLACLNSFAFDFCARSKIQGQHLNWFIVEQLPVLTPTHYDHQFGNRSAKAIVKDHVLRLTYTAHDMGSFARKMGYLEADGTLRPPIIWNETERRHLRTRLDALHLILYGFLNDDDIRYVLSTFPIVERQDRETHGGVYLTQELILWYKHALEAGDADTVAPEPELLHLAATH